MSVNLGHPVGHVHFFEVSIIVSEGRENIGIMSASRSPSGAYNSTVFVQRRFHK